MNESLSPLEPIVAVCTRWCTQHREQALTAFSDENWPVRVWEANDIERRIGSKPPARILDLACGRGRPTMELALRGYDVIGLDCTPAMLDIAKEMAAKKGAKVTWVLQDMRLIDYENEIDYVLLRDVIFGMYGPKREHELVVRNIARALKPGGRLLLEVYNRSFAKRNGLQSDYRYDESADTFVPKRADENGPESVKMLSEQEVAEMLQASRLDVVLREGWKWPKDPEPPPWRADILVAEKAAE